MSALMAGNERGRINGRLLALFPALVALALIIAVLLGAWAMGERGIRADFTARNLAPQAGHGFGTDAMGRDMLARAFHGLALSLRLGLLTAGLSVFLACLIAMLSGLGRRADALASFVTDAMLAMPHLLLLMLLSFAMGGGTRAVIIAVAISHWPRLARILRLELMQLMQAPYIETARALGRGRPYIICNHILPHLWPQISVGFLLMFPHAILHEAGLSFLGFGLEPSRPAIGVMLAEAMRQIGAGRWWLALFPGAMLLIMVLALEVLGNALGRVTRPRQAQC